MIFAAKIQKSWSSLEFQGNSFWESRFPGNIEINISGIPGFREIISCSIDSKLNFWDTSPRGRRNFEINISEVPVNLFWARKFQT